MTDEGYACSGCGCEDCPNGYTEIKVNDTWKNINEYIEGEVVQEERHICGETGKPAKQYLVWTTEED